MPLEVHKNQIEIDGRPVYKRGLAFWLIFVVLSVVSLLSALEASAIGVALPRIVTDLTGERLYIWYVTAYLITAAAFMPIWGQLADVFGRRSTLMSSIILFALGSGLAGGARSSAMLIAARVIQGMGGAGQLTLTDIIISDIVPLRERGKFVGIIGGVWALGTVVGPLLGGALANAGQWRWIFYLNVPISMIALMLAFIYLRVQEQEGSITSKIKRLDYFGASLLIASLLSIQLALAKGGIDSPWQSWRTLVPLLVGFAGLGMFISWIILAHRMMILKFGPLLSPVLFRSKTANVGYLLTFLHGIIVYGFIYMIPVYFEGILNSSTLRTGVDLFPFTFVSAPFAIIGGAIVNATGNYKYVNIMSFAFLVLSIGLFQLLSSTCPDYYWIVFQILFGIGAGAMFVVSLSPIQAAVPSHDLAAATALYAFMRNFGAIWGLAINTAIFDYKINVLGTTLPDGIYAELQDGGAYALSALGYDIFGHEADSVKNVATMALQYCWWSLFAVAVAGLIGSFFYDNLELSTILESNYGMPEQGTNEKHIGSEVNVC